LSQKVTANDRSPLNTYRTSSVPLALASGQRRRKQAPNLFGNVGAHEMRPEKSRADFICPYNDRNPSIGRARFYTVPIKFVGGV